MSDKNLERRIIFKFCVKIGKSAAATLALLTLAYGEYAATDPEARVRFSALPGKKIVGLERGPLSLVSTTEELLDRKVAAPV
jgi:hypothetical protein